MICADTENAHWVWPFPLSPPQDAMCARYLPACFSSHTAFPVWHMLDTTDMMKPYIDAWEKVDIFLDAIYSGFLGAPEQVDSIQRLYALFPNALRVVDPVMADHGKIYPTYTKELCDAMATLADGADILTPNLPPKPRSSSAPRTQARTFLLKKSRA